MTDLKNSILVPYDLTAVADYAVEHCVYFCKPLQAKVVLLHIAKAGANIEELEQKLKEKSQKAKTDLGIEVGYIVREGNIFKTINEVAEEIEAQLIVMGTHGLRGLQKVTGSWALKVIVGSNIPYVVVQDHPEKMVEPIKVVFPVDFKSENKEKLRWAEMLSKTLKTKIYLFSATQKEGVIEPRTKANVVFCRKFMEEKGIDYELVLAEGKVPFWQETIAFSEKINAGLIIIMTTREIAFHDYVLGAQEQHIIANNAKIPVMVINPRTDIMKLGYGGF